MRIHTELRELTVSTTETSIEREVGYKVKPHWKIGILVPVLGCYIKDFFVNKVIDFTKEYSYKMYYQICI